MGIEAPRFDFQSLNAPGGIGQGLGALSSALIDAQGRRRQNEMDQARLDFEKQGLARLQANDLANRSQQAMQFQEGVNSHRADEEYRTGQLKRQDGLAALADTRYKEGEKRQVVQDRLAAEERTYQHGRTDKIDAANIGKNNAEAEHYRKMVPSVPADHTKLTPATYAQLSQIAQKRAQARVDAEMFDPQYIKDKANAGHKDYYNPWNTPAPTPVDPHTKLQQYLQEEHANLGIPTKAPQWGIAPTAANATNTGSHVTPSAPSLRDRVTAAYGQNLHPDIAKSLAEAETGDAASKAQLESILQQHEGNEGAAETVAPGEELDLLGNPR